MEQERDDNCGLLAVIFGAEEYNKLTGIDLYAIPCKPASYDPTITNATPDFLHEDGFMFVRDTG